MVFSIEQRIIHHLILKSNSMKNIGLVYGKMGLAVFFSFYGKSTDNEVYLDIGSDLLDEVLNSIEKGSSLGFGSGLCGIGWGVEYLIRNNIVDACGIDICEDLDKEIMNRDIRRLDDLSLDTGLEGMLHYILSHISGSKMQNMKLPFDAVYLQEAYSVVKSLNVQSCKKSLIQVSEMYVNFFEKGILPDQKTEFDFFIKHIELDEAKLLAYPLSLGDGLAGYMVNRLEKMRYNNKCI